MKSIKAPSDLTISTIKELFQDLKKCRKILNWGEFADKIEKDRTYMSRIMNGHEPLTDTVREVIFSTFVDTTKDVISKGVSEPDTTYQAQKSQPLESAGLSLTLGDYIEEIKRSRAFAERMLESGIKDLAANLKDANDLLLALRKAQLSHGSVIIESLERIETQKTSPISQEVDKRESQLTEKLKRKGKTDGKHD